MTILLRSAVFQPVSVPLWVFLVLGLALLSALVLWTVRRRVKRRLLTNPLEDLGFSYDPAKGIVYSNEDAWQRRFGYCQLYDEAAPGLGMIIDCEPVRFDYGGKHWLVEFWKGQYGVATGAEIGVYTSSGPRLRIPGVFDGTFYNETLDENFLTMRYTLWKGRERVFSRSGRHWWLTGFVPGLFSEPEELSMQIRIRFPTDEMCGAFLEALVDLGYPEESYRRSGPQLDIDFRTPHSPQPVTRTQSLEYLVQRQNQKLCGAYQAVAGDAEDLLEGLERFQAQNPGQYRKLVRAIRPEEGYQGFDLLAAMLEGGGE